MTKMTAAHLEAVVGQRDHCLLMAEARRKAAEADNSPLHRDMAVMLDNRAARLSEVADHLAAQIRENDDAGQ